MSRPRRLLLTAMACALLVLAACTPDPSPWYPAGTAALDTVYESTNGSTKNCTVTVKITNTGQSEISLSTVSVAVSTAARTYRKTFTSEVRIVPGKSVFASTTVDYADAAEALQTDGVSIVEQFYQ